ncbi:MAG: HAD hydrolase family protein [Clostridia bacterium]|nr:HAD hydrolase family protein [Clostridia bacterium]
MDIDGTLIDKKGKLDPDVYDLFTKADLDKTNFILMTGNSVDNAYDCIDQINAILPKGKKITPWISASCGSTIISPQKDQLNQANISPDFITEITTKAEAIDPKVVFMFRNGKLNLIEKPTPLSKNGIMMFLYKYKEAKKGSAGIQFTYINKQDRAEYIKNNDIQNVFVVSLDKEKKPLVDAEIQKISAKFAKTSQLEYPVYPGFATQTPARSKENALQIILNNDQNLCDDIADVIYFGDGTNDVTCLASCKYSFARGADAKPAAIKAAKYHYNNLSAVADALYSDESVFTKNMQDLPNTEVVAEQGLTR